MSDEAGTAGGEPVTVVTLASDAPASFSSADEAFRHLTEARKKAAEPEKPAESAEPEKAATAEPELAQANEDPQDAAPLEDANAADPEENLPPIEPPRSWTKAEKERFNSLPRETQEYLHTREQERERDFRRSQNEQADKLKAIAAREQEVERLRQQYEAKLPALEKKLQTVGPFADIQSMDDLRRLQAEDPFRFQQYQLYTWEQQAEQQELRDAESRKTQERQNKRNAYEAEQNKLLVELVPEMAEPKKASELRERAIAMLTDDLGLKNDQLSRWMQDDTGHEILSNAGIQKLIADGLKYRDILKAPKAVAAKPLPNVQRPGVRQASNAGVAQQIQALEKQLDKASGNQAFRLAAELTALRRKAG